MLKRKLKIVLSNLINNLNLGIVYRKVDLLFSYYLNKFEDDINKKHKNIKSTKRKTTESFLINFE